MNIEEFKHTLIPNYCLEALYDKMSCGRVWLGGCLKAGEGGDAVVVELCFEGVEGGEGALIA